MSVIIFSRQLSTKRSIFWMLWLAAILSFCILVSLPILQAGFYGDDIWDSLIKGRLMLNHKSIWDIISIYTEDWLAKGRFFPLNVFSTTAFFYLFSDFTTCQIVRAAFIWLSLFSFAWLAKLIAKDNTTSLLFLFLVPMCWSIKVADDPLTTYAIFMPLLTIFIALSLGSFVKFQETEQHGWLEISFFMYLCALATYELGVITCFLLLILAMTGPYAEKKLLTALWPFFLTLLVYGLLNVRLQYNSTTVYPGVQIGVLAKFWPAFLAQLSSTFPLSYRLSLHGPQGVFHMVCQYLVSAEHVLFVICLSLVALVCIYQLLQKINLTKTSIHRFFLLGAGVMVLPAALIGINGRYQNSVTIGKGYIPVYIQYIGMAFVMLALFGLLNQMRLRQPRQRILNLCVACCASLIIVLSAILNFNSVDKLNLMVETSYRSLVENALHHKLLAAIPEHASIIENYRIWNTKDFYMLHGRVKLDAVIALNGFEKLPDSSLADNLFLMDGFHLPRLKEGYVFRGNFISATQIKNPLVFIAANNQDNFNKIIQSLRFKLHLSQSDINLIAAAYAKASNQKEILYRLPEKEYTLAGKP